MKKNKTISILLLIFVSLFLLSRSNEVKAIWHEGTTGTNAGGPSIYTDWFDDYSGVLIVSSTFANGSGAEFVDITASVVCTDPNRYFRLRIWDSDAEQFIEPEKEVGLGTNERRGLAVVHMDKQQLFLKIITTDANGLAVYAEINLFFLFDEGVMYQGPITEGGESISEEEHKREILNTNLSYLVTISLTVVFTGALVIQREGTGVKSFISSKVKKHE